jgi:hypothetical protein
MYLYASATQHLSSPVRLTIDQLKRENFNTENHFQLFEINGEIQSVSNERDQFDEVSARIPKMGIMSSVDLAKSNTWSAHDHIYGVRVKGNKRTGAYDNNADRITCSCGKFAYKHVKVWEPAAKQLPLYVCECHLTWIEKEL